MATQETQLAPPLAASSPRPVNRTAELTTAYLASLVRLLRQLPLRDIERVCPVLYQAYQNDQTLFLFGNGGSAALASHMACDLGKGTFAPHHVPLHGVKRFKVFSLTDNVPLLSAWANDTAYENVFAEQLGNLVRPGDIAFGISGSGNSPNVLKALKIASAAGAITVGLTGNSGGKMKSLLDYAIVVPGTNMQQIEDAHAVVAHMIFLVLQQKIAGCCVFPLPGP